MRRLAGEGAVAGRSTGTFRGELMVGHKFVEGSAGQPNRLKDVRDVYCASRHEALDALDELRGEKRLGRRADTGAAIVPRCSCFTS